MPHDPPHTPEARALAQTLHRVRTRARTLLVIRRAGLLAGAVLIAAVAGAVLDAWLRFPTEVRTLAFLVIVSGIAVALVRWVLPAVRFCPALTDVALRVERARPETRGRLASAIDLAGLSERAPSARVVDAGPTHDALARRAVEDATASFKPTDALAIINATPATRGASAALVALLLAIAPALLVPTLWSIGVQRILTPWTDAAWPKRTGVIDATALHPDLVHPLGESLALRAVLTKWRTDPDREDVAIRYRTIDEEGDTSRARRLLMTMQGEDTEAGGYAFERLIDASGVALEYRLETDDDATGWTRVELIEPPTVTGARATITPPIYATGGDVRRTEPIDLGSGNDERAAAPLSLAGSRVDLRLTLNRGGLGLESADGGAIEPTLESVRTLVGDAARVDAFDAEEGAWTLSMTLNETTRLELPLVDVYGFTSVDTSVYRFDAIPDRAPGAAITTPERDMTVLPSAVVETVAEGRDDVGLRRVALEVSAWRPAGANGGEPSGPGGALERDGEPIIAQEASLALGTIEEKATARVVRAAIDLADLSLSPGDEVRLVALATDLFVDASGVERDPTRSSPRTLRLIDEDAFVEELRDALGAVREEAIRLEQQQREVRRTTGERGAERASTRAQAQLAERLAQRAEDLGDLAERVEQNRLEDDALRELLAEAQDAARRAGEAASEASQRLAEARANAENPDDGAPLPEGEARELEDEQVRAEQELASLIEMLDRGEDNWVVRNAIARLIDRQRALEERTGQLGQETAGLRPEELTEAQARELEDIVREQQELAQDTDELVEDLRAREQAMRESDPAGAQGLRQAAQRAQQRQTSQRMENAAQQAEQNRTNEAQDEQQAAQEALEEMLQDLDDNERNRRDALRRALLSITESIEALIEQQSEALVALRAGTESRALIAGLIRLADNTSQVSGQARATGQELVPVANLLDRAVDAQSDAIDALREEPPDREDAADRESRSLELLEEALARAEDLEEQLEQEELEEKKRELKRSYREALELQIALRERTRLFADLERMSRRDRVRLRQLGPAQEQIRVQLDEIRAQTEEIGRARVYAYAHGRLDRLAQRAIASMESAAPGRAVGAQDAIVDTLADLLDSLEDPEPEDRPFEDGVQGGQQGGGQGQGGQQQDQLFTELGELRLLRELQIAIAEDTAAAGADDALSDLDTLAGEQDELAGVAAELVERITRQRVPLEFLPENGGRDPLDDAPTPDGPEAPDDGGEQP